MIVIIYYIHSIYIAWFLDSEINFDQLWSCWNKCGHVTHIAAHITHWTDGDATNNLIAWHLTRDRTHDRTAGFQKNEYWASCKTSCTPGIDPADPPEHATPWTCKARCSFRSSQALGPWDFVIFVGFPLVSVGFQPGRCCPRRSWSKHSRSQTIFRARWLSCATNSLP